ncbi:hypothetical protein [Glycomyces tritici]|uniref:YbaB/EbfC family DNA-binding protein n=1 Tax=Glycomyces tritici TaxID=2665176 RepID=A0ABT7YMP3_9ACTN|nr:hypothetical protein [Glycomyces tritici]MDN3239908.1 hypothetical protein [Glycomyces tritici]
MSSDFIERARRAAERLSRNREQLQVLSSTELTSDDGMISVKLDIMGRPEISIERGRTYSFEEYEVKMILIETYNRAVQLHAQQLQEAAGSATEFFSAIAPGREQ